MLQDAVRLLAATVSRAVGVAAAVALLAGAAQPAAAADAVTEWSLLADSVAHGSANWHTLAIMHQAMHDARNAAEPVYIRWFTPTSDEPAGAGADPDAAIDQTYQTALARTPDGPAHAAGKALGEAIGSAALARRRDDGFRNVRPFPEDKAPGRWRRTPPEFRTSYTTDSRPFLFVGEAGVDPQQPPAAGSPRFQAAAAEVQRLGSLDSTDRTQAQSDGAMYWAYQSSQRGYLHLWPDLPRQPAGAVHRLSVWREAPRASPRRASGRWTGSPQPCAWR